ncbi:Transposon-encoded protein with ribonuclease H-like integrase domains [Klebsormidium nitens]|uniref:Transposon-encoded protein with ribonuclease H-like integrase domains n=1 Tax=Klebsormidium nitens TaxID=105231 RepID=A0A1Y1IMJ8_KLENI|nr:Transposon-encoded protein with ribonuclease H-like integrase domains [Klebsormidium nitens]|eukprot:GAQ89817.1 Transposon-encoded protein with ribonuclease H-like integrase domains [Klebsormidium nitens]
MKPNELTWSVLAGLPKTFSILRRILEASESAISLVDAILPKLLVHEQEFYKSPKEKSGGGSDPAVTYVAGRKGKEKVHGKDESPGKGPKCYNCAWCGHIARKCSKPDRREHNRSKRRGKNLPMVWPFASLRGVSTNEWLVDSCSSQHITGDKSLFEILELFKKSGREFTFGDKGTLWVEGSGSVELQWVAANLISVSKATEVASVMFKENGRYELEVDGDVVLVARKVKGVYVVNRAAKDTCFFVKKPETAELWHRRLGHVGYENFQKMVQGDVVEGLEVEPSAFRALETSVCEPCIMGKQSRLPFPGADSVSTEPLELVYMDVCGPIPVASVEGSRYFATFLDDYSKLSVVVLMKQKSEVAKVTEHVINPLELQPRKQLKLVRTDRGKEYVNKAFKDVFGGKGMVDENTAPNSAKQNGSAERPIRVFGGKDPGNA